MAKERGATVRFPPPLIFVSALVTGLLLDRFGRAFAWPVDRALGVAAGVVFVALGLSLIASARLLFWKTGQSPMPWKPSPSLIAAGPYRFTRNPMYLGATCILLGIGGLTNDAWIDLLAPLALVIVHVVVVRPEERYLRERFGETYDSYAARVRRYL